MDEKNQLVVGLHYDPKTLMELTDKLVNWLKKDFIQAELYEGILALEAYRRDIKDILECIDPTAVDIKELLKDKN